jgi:hypothetical protein
MGDWCGEVMPTHFQRNNGSRKRRLITSMEVDSNVVPCKEKYSFSLDGGVYSLTRGLLMGDPVYVRTPFSG